MSRAHSAARTTCSVLHYKFLLLTGERFVAGVVKYVGKVAGRDGTWAGVQLEKPGKSNQMCKIFVIQSSP